MSRRKSVSSLPAGFDKEQSRRQGNRPKRRNILIVCEGEKTEPHYFEAFRKVLVGGEGDRIEVVGTGENTIGLVEAARKKTRKTQSSRRTSVHIGVPHGATRRLNCGICCISRKRLEAPWDGRTCAGC